MKLTTMPVMSNDSQNNAKLIESDSLIEIQLNTIPQISNFIDFEPAYISFNNLDWSETKSITFTALDDDTFTALEIIIEINFTINSIDRRYDSINP